MHAEARDLRFMRLAMRKAREAYSAGDFPVGAVLIIGGRPAGLGRNSQRSRKDWASHAELSLIVEQSARIKAASMAGTRTELFTTLEPCAMCMGAMVQHRIDRIVYACPDPFGGASDMRLAKPWHREVFPEVGKGPLRDESYNLVIRHMERFPEEWVRIYPAFRRMDLGQGKG